MNQLKGQDNVMMKKWIIIKEMLLRCALAFIKILMREFVSYSSIAAPHQVAVDASTSFVDVLSAFGKN